MNVSNTVFIVDPDESSQDYLREIADEMGVPCEGYDSGEDFLAAYKESRRGCLVSELRLSGISGIELQETLAADCISLPVLFVTCFANMQQTVRAMQNGAMTVLGKPVRRQDLREAVWKAVAHSKEIHRVDAARQRIRARFATLSRRERSVLPFVLAAMPNKSIARQLEVSKRIIEVARCSIFKKTCTNSVAELWQMLRVANMDGECPSGSSLSVGQGLSRQLQQVLDRHREMLAHASQMSTPELVGGLVHEISQPLQAIANFSSIIESAVRPGQTLDVNQIREWNEMISKASTLATEIIRRFRASIVHRKVDRIDVSLQEIIRESITMLKFTAQEKHVNVLFEPNRATAKVDRVQIQQVVINLLKNAIEAAAENSTNDRAVTVKIISKPNSVEIIVSDNGNGISDADVPDLFEPFLSSKSDGLGLGLATSKTIVESHDGRIWHEQNSPQGASFHVQLPRSG